MLILSLTLTESSLAAPRVVARDNTLCCRRRPGRHVILLMMQRKFCFFLKVYRFLWCCHIDILSGLSISLPQCYVLCYFTVLYTHTCDIFYVCYMYIWFYECFVRNGEIKLWNRILLHVLHIQCTSKYQHRRINKIFMTSLQYHLYAFYEYITCI